MKLNVLERLGLLNILPSEGSFTNLKLIRKAKEELSFDEKENKALGFRQTEDRLMWNEVDIIKDVKLGEVATMMIVDRLKKLDKEGALKEEQFSLYEKFVEKGE